MKLQRGVYPDFYKERKAIIDENVLVFVGRKLQFEFFWMQLWNASQGLPTDNYALIAQRKMGKTASLARFFNVAFWEQDEVVPLYYCFKNRRRNILEVADEMVATWLKQWLAFLLKDPKIIDIKTIAKLELLLKQDSIPKDVCEKMLLILDDYLIGREQCTTSPYIGEKFLLDHVFQLVNSLTQRFDQPCMCIVDEFQETDSGNLVDSKMNPVHNSGPIEDIAENQKVWTMVSGSKVSMLVDDIITDDIANRIESIHFEPLEQQESDQLVREMIARENYSDVYESIEDDIFQLFGGNPYYIVTLFKRNWRYNKEKKKHKSFADRKQLAEVFEFEVSHSEGKIFRFWEKQFIKNAEKLNATPPGKPGLTYDILRQIIDRPEISKDKLSEIFSLDYAAVEDRLRRLREADLLFSIHDPVLRLILPQIRYKRVEKAGDAGGITAEATTKLIQKEIQALNQGLTDLKDRTKKTEEQQKSLEGRINQLQGAKLEEGIKEALLKGRGPLNGYRIVGGLQKIYVGRPSQKEWEIDLAGDLEEKNANGKAKPGRKPKIGLAVEVRDRRSKMSSKDADKFIKATACYKKQHKLTKVVGIFVNRNGFSKPALKLLAKHGIIASCIEDFENCPV